MRLIDRRMKKSMQTKTILEKIQISCVTNKGFNMWVIFFRILGAPAYDYEAVHLSAEKFTARHTAFQYIQLLRSRRIM